MLHISLEFAAIHRMKTSCTSTAEEGTVQAYRCLLGLGSKLTCWLASWQTNGRKQTSGSPALAAWIQQWHPRQRRMHELRFLRQPAWINSLAGCRREGIPTMASGSRRRCLQDSCFFFFSGTPGGGGERCGRGRTEQQQRPPSVSTVGPPRRLVHWTEAISNDPKTQREVKG